MTPEKIHHLGVDVATRDKKKLMRRLAQLKTTLQIEDGGAYNMDNSYSQIWVDTHLTEEALDDWLYRVNHKCEYFGVFDRAELCYESSIED